MGDKLTLGEEEPLEAPEDEALEDDEEDDELDEDEALDDELVELKELERLNELLDELLDELLELLLTELLRLREGAESRSVLGEGRLLADN